MRACTLHWPWCLFLVCLVGVGFFIQQRGMRGPVAEADLPSGRQHADGRHPDQRAHHRAKSTRARTPDHQKLLHEVEKTKEVYFAKFRLEAEPGMAKAVWHNAPTVRFWLDLLASSNPDQVELAINVLEAAANQDQQSYMDARGNVLPNLKMVEKDAVDIYSTMLRAQSQAFAHRAVLNLALEQANNDGQIAEIEGGIFARFDGDDGRVLRDATVVIETFVPRLSADDPSSSDAALRVLNLFTYNLFSDEDVSWWEWALDALKRKELPQVIK